MSDTLPTAFVLFTTFVAVLACGIGAIIGYRIGFAEGCAESQKTRRSE